MATGAIVLIFLWVIGLLILRGKLRKRLIKSINDRGAGKTLPKNEI